MSALHPNENDSETDLHIFRDLSKFVKVDTGLSITLAYIILILSSMAYLSIYYYAFNIHIIKFITLEDILATPIRNPTIIFIFVVMLFYLYISDLGIQFNLKQRRNPKNQSASVMVKFLVAITWVPKNKSNNVKLTVLISLFVLAVYIHLLSKGEAKDIKQGNGPFVEITLTDDPTSIKRTLLGSSTFFVFTYDHVLKQAEIFQVDSIKSIKPVDGLLPLTKDVEDSTQSPTVDKTTTAAENELEQPKT